MKKRHIRCQITLSERISAVLTQLRLKLQWKEKMEIPKKADKESARYKQRQKCQNQKEPEARLFYLLINRRVQIVLV